MDRRWWIWNILFSLLPAITITIYCETRGKQLVNDYTRKLEIAQLKSILGDEEFSNERVDEIIQEKNRIFKEKRQYDLDQVVYNAIVTMIVETYKSLENVVVQQIQQLFLQKEEESNENNINNIDNQDNEHTVNTMTSSNKNAITMASQGTSQQSEEAVVLQQHLDSHEESKYLPVEDLQRRIKQIEILLNIHTNHTEEEISQLRTADNDAEANRRIIQKMNDRNHGSNIRNRYEIDNKDEWKQPLSNLYKKSSEPQAIQPPSVAVRNNEKDIYQQPIQEDWTSSILSQVGAFGRHTISTLLQLIGTQNDDIDEIKSDKNDEKHEPNLPMVQNEASEPIHAIRQNGNDSPYKHDLEMSQSMEPPLNSSSSLPWWHRFWKLKQATRNDQSSAR